MMRSLATQFWDLSPWWLRAWQRYIFFKMYHFSSQARDSWTDFCPSDLLREKAKKAPKSAKIHQLWTYLVDMGYIWSIYGYFEALNSQILSFLWSEFLLYQLSAPNLAKGTIFLPTPPRPRMIEQYIPLSARLQRPNNKGTILHYFSDNITLKTDKLMPGGNEMMKAMWRTCQRRNGSLLTSQSLHQP